jgi:hypothetical protein
MGILSRQDRDELDLRILQELVHIGIMLSIGIIDSTMRLLHFRRITRRRSPLVECVDDIVGVRGDEGEVVNARSVSVAYDTNFDGFGHCRCVIQGEGVDRPMLYNLQDLVPSRPGHS